MLPALLPQLSDFVRAQLGLHFPPERFADLERGVRAAASELGFDAADDWARTLLGQARTSNDTAVLASHLTVGETYFFRDPAAFEALDQIALPELLKMHARPLRIWSAACCTGEEAYSLAISVQRAAGRRAPPAAKVLATDINARFLVKAAAGVFGQWSFRGVPEEVRSRYFQPAGDGRWKIEAALREMITFQLANLSDASWQPPVEAFGTMDIIFCRNVLMYFAADDARRVAGKIASALNDGGWLFSSAAEASHDLFDGLTRADLPGVSAFRKVTPPADRLAGPKGLRPSSDSSPGAPLPDGGACAVMPEGANSTPQTLADLPHTPAPPETLDGAAHYLRGITLQESGASEEAAAALRRALYLDPELILAHFAHGNLMLRMRREREAALSFENARALLRRLDPGDPLPHGDGLTAARLLAVLDATPPVGT